MTNPDLSVGDQEPTAAPRAQPTLTGSLTFSGRYLIFRQPDAPWCTIVDDAGRPVATIPALLGGEARTRTDCWQLAFERRRRRQVLVAKTLDGTEAGTATLGWIPGSFRLTLARGERYRLASHALTAEFVITLERNRVGRLSNLDIRVGGELGRSNVRRSVPAGVIEISTDSFELHDLALPIVLALEMLKAEALTPSNAGTGT